MAEVASKNWYVIRAVSGQEAKIKDYIMGEISRLGYADQVDDMLVPMEKVVQIRNGKKINKESKWTKFWQGAAWILYEHGDEIFKVILDLKYDTNYSGYNTSNKTTNNRSGLRCTGQRVGDMIYENCTGGGVFIRCTTTIIGQMAKRRCREI